MQRQPNFPGMDPWLEHPAIWPDLHNSYIGALRDALVPLVAPRYYVSVESRMTTLVLDEPHPRFDRPDLVLTHGDLTAPMSPPAHQAAEGEVAVLEVDLPFVEEVEETYLEIREVGTHQLVTVLEVLSPSNKTPEGSRDVYMQKRSDILASWTNLIEIDLLRTGEPMPLACLVEGVRDYHVLIARGRTTLRARMWAFGVRAALPAIPIPLLPGDEEPRLDLNRALHNLFDRARYFRRIDSTRPPIPPLRPADAAWAAGIVAEDQTPHAEDRPR